MDGARFDRWARRLGTRVGRRRILQSLASAAAIAALGGDRVDPAAQSSCPSPCKKGRRCVDGRCVKACSSDRECRSRVDACVGGRCDNGVCVQFDASCSAGYVCCGNGECCPTTCTTSIDCFTGDPCTIATCGTDGICAFSQRDPCVTCSDDSGCGAGSVCCTGVCVRACPEGTVLGKGCECELPPGTGDASGIVVIDNANGNATDQSGGSPAAGGGETSGPSTTSVNTVDTPPSVVTTGS